MSCPYKKQDTGRMPVLHMKTRTIMQVYREKRLDRPLALIVTILMAIGTVMVFSAAANLKRELEWSKFLEYTTMRQILFFPLAIIVMYVMAMVPYRVFSLEGNWKKSVAVWLLAVSAVLLILVLVPGVGIERNNARRWLPLGHGLSFQPSEIAKWSVIIFMAAYIGKFPGSMHLFRERFVPMCAMLLPVVGLVLVEDLGTAALMIVLAFIMLLPADTCGGVRV
jgi:cell division protein FtsW